MFEMGNVVPISLIGRKLSLVAQPLNVSSRSHRFLNPPERLYGILIFHRPPSNYRDTEA